MASAREVEKIIRNMTEQIKRATKEVDRVTDLVRQLEDTLEKYDADDDLDVTRGLRRTIKRGKDEISDLRKSVDKLDRELSDTNRKFHNLSR